MNAREITQWISDSTGRFEMLNNIGAPDRIIRIVAGVVLAILPFVFGGGLAAAWPWWVGFAVGVVLLATAALNFCPLYRVLGITTNR